MPASRCDAAAAPAALVFDIDGTLIDTLPAVHAALDRTLAIADRPGLPRALVRQHFSAGMAGLLRAALRQGGDAPAPRFEALHEVFVEAYLTCLPDLARPYAGADALLRRLAAAGWPLGICSNGDARALTTLLQTLGWTPLFAAVVHADNAQALKPSAAPLLQVLHALGGVAPGAAWLVGDSELDARCARAAGTGFVWHRGGYGGEHAGHGAWLRIDRPDHLLNRLPPRPGA